jgi:hypothetical protein
MGAGIFAAGGVCWPAKDGAFPNCGLSDFARGFAEAARLGRGEAALAAAAELIAIAYAETNSPLSA